MDSITAIDNNNNASSSNNNDNAEINTGDLTETITYHGLRVMPYIIGNEIFERVGTIGSQSNLLIYLYEKFHMEKLKANQVVNVFAGTCDIATLVGAFLSNTFFCPFNCLAASSVASFVGLMMLMLTAAVPNLHPAKKNEHTGATPSQRGFLFAAFGWLVIGAGGIRSCSLTFGADQFPPNSRGSKSFFMWYFATIGITLLVSMTFIAYLQTSVSWVAGLAVPAFLMFISIVLFVRGTNMYVRVRPQGSPLTSFAQVFVAAFNKRNLELPENRPASLFNYVNPGSTITRLQYTDQFRFLDKAAIIIPTEINTNGSAVNPWRLCTVQQVEELKCWLRIMPTWVSSIFFNFAFNVHSNLTTFQALQLNINLGKNGFQIPPTSYVVFSMLTGTLFVPIYDRILVPVIQRKTGRVGGFTLLQRMGAGIIFLIFTLLVSGIVEKIRKHDAFSGSTYSSVSSLSAFVLLPQLILVGVAEACGLIAQMNFYYDHMPEITKTFAQVMVYASGAIAKYSSPLILSIFNGNW